MMMMLTDSGDAATKRVDDNQSVVWTTADDVAAQRHNEDDGRVRYRAAAAEPLRQSGRCDDAMRPVVYAYGRAAAYHCDCDACRSTNTSLYPMIGSCTTSSCHVDARPRPPLPYSEMFVDGSTLTDCSTCCVYEYALDMDSFQTEELEHGDSGSERTVDCSSAVRGGASLSWLTVHSAPAVLGRLARYKPPAAAHRQHLHNRTTVRRGRERHEPYPRDARREFCGCRSSVYRTDATCYQPVPYTTYRCSTAAAADADDAYRRLSPSLRVAKPVLAETQYWV